ncbi:hypothetical protein L0F63_003033 [Massospora cicadina]|nr:hypothetical protein L0F63_003033 [Massospora cicadina]
MIKVLIVVGLGVISAIQNQGNVTPYQGDVVIQLAKSPQIEKLVDEFDVWTSNHTTYQVRVNREQLKSIEKANGKYSTVIHDVHALLSQSSTRAASGFKMGKAEWFRSYHRLDEIVNWYRALAKKHPTVVKFIPSIGKSAEGRNLSAIHITNSNHKQKKKVWFQSLIHAREWITAPTLQYVLNHLINHRESEPIKSLLDQVEIIAVPVVNPDGYSFTWTDQRLWRKNRRVVNGGVGIDLNRNFPYKWGEANGGSKNPKSETYQGPSPASEPEVKAILAYFQKQSPMLGAIDFHSYSQLILRPFGTTSENAPDESNLVELGNLMAADIAKVGGRRYVNEKSIELYPVSGSASDWFYGREYKTYGYTVELSPTSNTYNGFILPPSQIIPVGEDLIPAVIRFINYVLKNPL